MNREHVTKESHYPETISTSDVPLKQYKVIHDY